MREALRVLALVISLGWMSTSSAQGIDPIKEICTNFLASNNLRAGASPDILCNCLVREITTKLSRDEMLAYQRSADTGRAMSNALNAKINRIAVTCLTEGR